ncbi:MAG: hypothetical protein WCL39_15250 [Armatimonadota bacterium]
MKKTIIFGFLVALLALSAGQLLALQTGTWDCLGYTVTITPDDPANPTLSGTLDITRDDDYAEVNVEGTYQKTTGKKPATVVHITGTIITPDGSIDVDKQFTFQPGPQKTIWKTVITSLESEIAG